MRLAIAFRTALALAALLAFTAKFAGAFGTLETVAAADLDDNLVPQFALAAGLNSNASCCAYGAPANASRASNGVVSLFAQTMAVQPSVFDVARQELVANSSFYATVFAAANVTNASVPAGDCRTQAFLQWVNASLNATVYLNGAVVAQNCSQQDSFVNESYASFANYSAPFPQNGSASLLLALPQVQGKGSYTLSVSYSVVPTFLDLTWGYGWVWECGPARCAYIWDCSFNNASTYSYPASAAYSEKFVSYNYPPGAQAVAGSHGGRQLLGISANFSTPFDAVLASAPSFNYSLYRYSFPLSVYGEPYNFTQVNAVPSQQSFSRNQVVLESSGGQSAFSELEAQASALQVSILSPFSLNSFAVVPQQAGGFNPGLNLSRGSARPGELLSANASLFADNGPLAGRQVVFSLSSSQGVQDFSEQTGSGGVAQIQFAMPPSNALLSARYCDSLGCQTEFRAIGEVNSPLGALLELALAAAAFGFVFWAALLAFGLRADAMRAAAKTAGVVALLLLAYGIFSVFS